MGEILAKLEEYYINYHKEKIFSIELREEFRDGRSFKILFTYEKKDEIQKFVSNFSEYLPYYVHNGDMLECLDLSNNISNELIKQSKKCWDGPMVPNRNIRVNGIFGEVFLDFYERIVRKAKVACTYAGRRGYHNNHENTGFDNVLFEIDDGKLEFIFAEAKFVGKKSDAKKSLIDDIKGSRIGEVTSMGHLTLEYLNDYICFIVEKSSFFCEEDRTVVKKIINELNNVLINDNGDFVSFLINKGIYIKCVFFAIFCDSNFSPEFFCKEYDKIYSEAKNNLEIIGFKNYSIEIVFIPTLSTSMDIKEAIRKHYE